MEEFNSFQRKMSNTKLKLSDLNPHLMCVLCGGYYIDATTIVECLHSFCRSCIVKHLESSKYCPICEVQVHKTKPLINIRPDKTLQDIVYKLVPGLFANEMRNRRKFYRERPHYIKPNNSESVGEVSGERKIYINDENITFSLVYHTGTVSGNAGDCFREISPPVQNEKRYFKCPTGVTIYHLKKLLKTKYDLNESNYKMEIYLKDQPLHEDLTLLDISYIYLWKCKGNLDLTYKIFENIVKRQKIEEKECGKELTETTKTEEQCLTQIGVLPKSECESEKSQEAIETKAEEKQDEFGVTADRKAETAVVPPAPSEKSQKEKMEAMESQKSESCPIKENGVADGESKEVQLQISESGVMSVSQVEDGEIVRTMEEAPPKVMNNQLITGLSLGLNKGVKGNGEGTKPETMNRIMPEQQRKPSTKPVKSYKTIRCSPKTWHPVIPKEKLRPTLIKNSDEPKKPLKFFKMRNMPRFLGNPSSGVKPMYAEPPENNAEEKKKQQEKKADATKNKILKIDPKTLRPIEKEEMKVTQAPTVPNLLTNPFIPNNNHFLFSDLHLLPPNSGNFSNLKSDSKGDKPIVGSFKTPIPNGSYPPICFPSPEHNPGFYPFSNLSKPQNFPFPVGDKMDPLLRASRLSPFGNLAGFNVAGFHASLPPSISRLLNPHHHFRKINQSIEKKNKDESTKESSNKICDDSVKASSKTNDASPEPKKENAKEEDQKNQHQDKQPQQHQQQEQQQKKENDEKNNKDENQVIQVEEKSRREDEKKEEGKELQNTQEAVQEKDQRGSDGGNSGGGEGGGGGSGEKTETRTNEKEEKKKKKEDEEKGSGTSESASKTNFKSNSISEINTAIDRFIGK